MFTHRLLHCNACGDESRDAPFCPNCGSLDRDLVLTDNDLRSPWVQRALENKLPAKELQP